MEQMAWNIMIGRLREKPGRAWLTTTPKGFNWIYDLFVERKLDNYQIIRSSSRQNPYLPKDFISSLELAYTSQFRAQEIEGKFIRPEGTLFQRQWFSLVDAAPAQAERVRYWDKAGTAGGGDFSAGVLMAKADGVYYIEDVKRGQWSPFERNRIIRQTAELDGVGVHVWLEQEPGSGGKESAQISIRELAGFVVKADRVTGSKEVRAQPFAAQAEAGNVRLVRGAWVPAYLDELAMFPEGAHDDQVDASSGAFAKLSSTSNFMAYLYERYAQKT